ncbi:MAG: sugar ABC transporter permease [Pseudomonadota bacterium]
MIYQRSTPYFFLAPAVMIIAIAAFYPTLVTVFLSLFDWELGQKFIQARFVGFENFTSAITDQAILYSVGTTLLFAFCVVGCEMILGISLALALEKPLKGTAFFRSIFILPIMIAPIVVGLLWRFIFDAEFGSANILLNMLGFDDLPWLSNPNLAFIAIIIADIWQWTPFVFILIFAGLKGVDPSIIEAAKMDRANSLQILFRIKLPMLMPVIMVTLLMRLIEAFRVLEVIFIMTFGGPGQATEILSMGIYKIAFIGGELGYASAAAVILLAIVGSLSFVLIRFSNPLKKR